MIVMSITHFEGVERAGGNINGLGIKVVVHPKNKNSKLSTASLNLTPDP